MTGSLERTRYRRWRALSKGVPKTSTWALHGTPPNSHPDLVRRYLGTDVQALVERERLLACHLTVLAWLADYAYGEQDYTACLDYAGRLLGHDPCREDAHRLIMRCYVRRGERAQALHQYRLCAEILRAQFAAT